MWKKKKEDGEMNRQPTDVEKLRAKRYRKQKRNRYKFVCEREGRKRGREKASTFDLLYSTYKSFNVNTQQSRIIVE